MDRVVPPTRAHGPSGNRGQRAHVLQAGLDIAQAVRRQRAHAQSAQHPVVMILIPQARGLGIAFS